MENNEIQKNIIKDIMDCNYDNAEKGIESILAQKTAEIISQTKTSVSEKLLAQEEE